MEKINLLPERRRKIAMANFDRYVHQRLIEACYVITDDGIDERAMSCLAKQVGCNPDRLHETIVNSLNRINKDDFLMAIKPEEEDRVMMLVAKLHIKESTSPMLNYKRDFGRILRELNHCNFDLNITMEELISFIKPLYLEVVEEIFNF